MSTSSESEAARSPFAIVPRLLGPEETISADRMEIHAGGVTANIHADRTPWRYTGWLGLIGGDETA